MNLNPYPDQITPRPGSGYDTPAFFDEGMVVLVPCTKAQAEAIGVRWTPGCAIKCKVVVAAGEHARVVHERAGIDRWVSRYGCVVKVAA